MGVSRRFHCRTLTAVLDVPILSCVLLCFEMADLVGLIYAGLIVTGGVVGYVKAGNIYLRSLSFSMALESLNKSKTS